ncbi:MAG: exodeoxyribonuclease VII large subunit [Candidatus Eisenbacteria bacterium]|nr:exodeoxyribonuclease VII large subunit [Candidatus Eisenbacteria bacterium]
MPRRHTVSEATALIKECIEGSLPPLWVVGELSNFVAHTSGHFYFSLKDAGAQLRCAMFRNANRRIRFRPRDGMECAALGRVGVYARSGQYQLIVERLLPVGTGELQAAFEALKLRLADEGLLATERKRPLPAYPSSIGLVTSPTGAAVRDLVEVLKRRWPPIRILLAPVRVQGKGAAEEIAGGLARLDRRMDLDLIVVGRGGGSLEDLWAFNEERVARAIAAARHPVISAVGHEIDTTISDLVADLRAPTPSAAAELAVPDYRDVLATAGLQRDRARRALLRRLGELRLRLEVVSRSHALRSPLDRMRQEIQHADALLRRARQALERVCARTADRTRHLGERLAALNPTAVLARGYALAFRADGGLLRSVAGLERGAAVRLELADGSLVCRVTSVEERSSDASASPPEMPPEGDNDEQA